MAGHGGWPRGRGPTGGKEAFRGLWRRGGGLGGAAKKKCLGSFWRVGIQLLSRLLIMPYVSSNLLVAHASCGTSGPSSTSKRSARVSSATCLAQISSPGRWLRTVPHFVLSFPSSLELRASRSFRARVRLVCAKLQAHARRAGGSGDWLPRSPLRCACATARYQGTIL